MLCTAFTCDYELLLATSLGPTLCLLVHLYLYAGLDPREEVPEHVFRDMQELWCFNKFGTHVGLCRFFGVIFAMRE